MKAEIKKAPMRTLNTSVLSINRVTKVFKGGFKQKDKIALNNVSITLEHGVYGILGPNGVDIY